MKLFLCLIPLFLFGWDDTPTDTREKRNKTKRRGSDSAHVPDIILNRAEATTRRLEAQLVEAAERNRRMERLSQVETHVGVEQQSWPAADRIRQDG